MFFIVQIPHLAALCIFLGLVVLGAFFYVRSKKSRTRYHCPNCGHSIQTELLKAEHCNICGAALTEARHDSKITGDY
jgi:hypothetical protein